MTAEAYDSEDLIASFSECRLHFETYATEQVECLKHLREEEPRVQWEILAAERDRLTELFLPMVESFNVSRKKLRRYIRSCENPAFNYLQEGRQIIGLFTPEQQANAIDAFVWYKYEKSEEAKQELRTHLPHALIDPEHWRPEEDSTSNNKESKKTKAGIGKD